MHRNQQVSQIYSWKESILHVEDSELEYTLHEEIQTLQTIQIDSSISVDKETWTEEWVLLQTYEVVNNRKKLSQESLYKNGKKYGPERKFYMNDGEEIQIAAEAWYRDGILHGRCFGWHPKTSVLILNLPYKNGKRQGVARHWNEQGVFYAEVPMNQGLFDGMMKSYNTTVGTISRMQEWKMGVRNGLDTLYHGEEGFLLFCDEWREGVKSATLLEDLLEKNLHRKKSN